jgi:hypothetical protein
MLISKLSNSYPVADPKIYLIGDTEGLDPLLAGGIAYVFKVESNKKGKIIKGTVTSGYRSEEEQEELYKQYQEGKIKLAAKPGTSKHQFRLAADMSTKPIRNMTNAELKQYGLCKPIKSEPWHIEPIEIQNSNWKQYEPTEGVSMIDRIKNVVDISNPEALEKQLNEQKNTSMWYLIDKLLKKLGV